MTTTHTVVHGEAIELLRELRDDAVDVCLTDPPYSDDTHSKQRRGATGYEEQRSGASRARISRTRDLGFDAITDEQRDLVAEQLARIVRRWSLLFTDDRGLQSWADACTRHGLDWIRTPVWEKLGATPQFTGDRPGTGVEFMLLVHRPGAKQWNGGGKLGVYRHAIVLNRHGVERFHTTQKPTPLMADLVRDFSNYGETVIDPFAGSGTTAVACKMWGRNSINFELQEDYAEIARSRIATAREDKRAPWRTMKQDKIEGTGFKRLPADRCSACRSPAVAGTLDERGMCVSCAAMLGGQHV